MLDIFEVHSPAKKSFCPPCAILSQPVDVIWCPPSVKAAKNPLFDS